MVDALAAVPAGTVRGAWFVRVLEVPGSALAAAPLPRVAFPWVDVETGAASTAGTLLHVDPLVVSHAPGDCRLAGALYVG